MICKPIETSDPFDMSKQIHTNPRKGAINPLFKEVYYFHFRWPGLNMLLGTMGRFFGNQIHGKVRLPEGIHIQNYTLYTYAHCMYIYIYTHIPLSTSMKAGN